MVKKNTAAGADPDAERNAIDEAIGIYIPPHLRKYRGGEGREHHSR